MPSRLRLLDFKSTRLPGLLGLCETNTTDLAKYVNSAQRRILLAPEAGDEGWWGTWAEITFTVSRTQPFITLPRDVARLESINVCDSVRPVNNQFVEYQRFGNGRMPKQCRQCDGWQLTEAFTRNNAVTWVELPTAPMIIRVYPASPLDTNNRIFFGGLDQQNEQIYTDDFGTEVQGVFLHLLQPFQDAPMTFNRITGIQKDPTLSRVRIVAVDPVTGDETDLLTMEPTELTASYRRYYFDQLPCFCCPPSTGTVTVCPPNSPQPIRIRAIAKLDLIPCLIDTDYLLIQNLEAIIEECQAVRYSEMDSEKAKGMEEIHHKKAIKLMNGEINHYVGQDSPAVLFAPFGSARLRRQRIGALM